MEKQMARALFVWWIIAIVFGAFANAWMAIRLFREGHLGGLMFAALALGCLLLCYRTYRYRDEAKNTFRR